MVIIHCHVSFLEGNSCFKWDLILASSMIFNRRESRLPSSRANAKPSGKWIRETYWVINGIFWGSVIVWWGNRHGCPKNISSPFKIWASIGNWYIYLEPYVWPLFLKVNPWKQGLFTPSKTRGPHQRVPGNTIIKWILEGGPLPFISTSRFITPLSGVIISPQENQLFFSHL